MEILFDPEAHKYTTLGGSELPSVTQLVSILGEDYDEPDDYIELAIDNAAERGTVMHDYIADRLRGGEDFELPDAYFGYADAVELFLAEHDITPLLVETALAGDGYAGTPDLVCEFDGAVAIIDYKFVSQVAKTKVGAQLHGYRLLCEANGIEVSELYAVQFLRDGTYRLYPVGGEGAADFELCRNLYQAKKKKHPRGKIS